MGIELACILSVGVLLGADGNLLGWLVQLRISCNCLAISDCLPPLEVGNGHFERSVLLGIKLGVELGGNMPFLRSKDRTWRIIAGTLDATAVLDPFNVSINSVNKRLVVVAVPGTNENESSWGNHWSVSWVLVLLVARL